LLRYEVRVTLRKELAESQALLQSRKARKHGKRVALKGKFVFSNEKVLCLAKEAEEDAVTKAGPRQQRQALIIANTDNTKGDTSQSENREAESDCTVVASRK
jgi:hypothetical protein